MADKVKAYPLIYGRTYELDYISGFLLRPDDFDAAVGTRYVSRALQDVKYCGGIRYAVFPVGEYIVYGGVACVSKILLNKIRNGSGEKLGHEILDFEKYLHDSSGREISFFAGFAVKKKEIKPGYVPKLDLTDTFRVYYEKIKENWYARDLTTISSEAMDVETVKYDEGGFSPKYYDDPTGLLKDLKILENYKEDHYQKIIDYFFVQMCKNPNTEESFLSGSFSKEAVGSPFKRTSLYGTTFQKFLSELEAEQKKKAEMQEKQKKQKKNQESSIHTMAELLESETDKSSQGNSQTEKKNMWLGIATSVLIIGIIILAILLM